MAAPRRSAKNQRVEIDVPHGEAGFLAFDVIDGQRSYIQLLPPVRPRHGGVVGRISWLPQSDDQVPLQRMLQDARDERVKKIILVCLRRPRRARRNKRLHRRERPAHRDRRAGLVGENECVEAVERAVVKSRRYGMALDDT